MIFVSYKEPEVQMPRTPDWEDTTSTPSKNMFDASMSLKCIHCLGQQGYRIENIVVLTPYLGQFRLLLDEGGKDSGLVLNDLDLYDLVRAGLTPAASADFKKPRIQIATIGKSRPFYNYPTSSLLISPCISLTSLFYYRQLPGQGNRYSHNLVDTE